MKYASTSAIVSTLAALPAFAHDDPVPHTHSTPMWLLALIGLGLTGIVTFGALKLTGRSGDES